MLLSFFTKEIIGSGEKFIPAPTNKSAHQMNHCTNYFKQNDSTCSSITL